MRIGNFMLLLMAIFRGAGFAMMIHVWLFFEAVLWIIYNCNCWEAVSSGCIV